MKTTGDKVSKLRIISREPISLDTPIGSDEVSTLGELIADRGNASRPTRCLRPRCGMKRPPSCERWFHGKSKCSGCVSESAAGASIPSRRSARAWMSRATRVRQIELRALRKLRRPESARRLRSLLT